MFPSIIISGPYQEEALASIPDAGAFLICMAVGLGKTVTFSQIPRRGRMLILSHRDELVHQPEKYFDCSFGVEQGSEVSHGEEVISASVQSLVRRLNKFKPDDFDVLITDECFPAGTCVDGMPIEQIQVGDYVTAYNHVTGLMEKKRVLHVFKRPAPAKMLRINSSLTCTMNHPIFEVNTGGYVNAIDLKLGSSMLYRVRDSHQLGGFDETSEIQISHDRPSILFEGMRKGILPEKIIRDNEPDKQKICFSTYEGSQSYEQYEYKSQNNSDTPSHRPQAKISGWKRTGNDSSTGFVNGMSCCAESSKRICCKNTCLQKQYRALSHSLQVGYSDTCRYDSDRGGWHEPYSISKERTRCEEREFFEVQRVDSIEILECQNLGGCNSLCSDGYVYNLEVEGPE